MNPFRSKPAVEVVVPETMRVDLALELEKVRALLSAGGNEVERRERAAQALGIVTVLCDALPGGGR